MVKCQVVAGLQVQQGSSASPADGSPSADGFQALSQEGPVGQETEARQRW